jgi:hypothetical protein
MRIPAFCTAAAIMAAGLFVYPCTLCAYNNGDAAAAPAYRIQHVDTLLVQAAPPQAYGAPGPQPVQEGPPGEWVEVPGTWVNGQWVPAHRTWVPVNPDGSAVAPAPPQQYPPPAQYPPPPAYTMPAPPQVLPIPRTYAYYVPGINIDVFFYQGYWYRPYGTYWYRAASYNGPWVYIPGPRVPHVLVTLPPGWRRVPPGYRPIPHADLQRNWRRWERDRHWDGHHRR